MLCRGLVKCGQLTRARATIPEAAVATQYSEVKEDDKEAYVDVENGDASDKDEDE
jgi:hypothetical protein